MANILLTSSSFTLIVQIMNLLERQQLREFSRNISKATNSLAGLLAAAHGSLPWATEKKRNSSLTLVLCYYSVHFAPDNHGSTSIFCFGTNFNGLRIHLCSRKAICWGWLYMCVCVCILFHGKSILIAGDDYMRALVPRNVSIAIDSFAKGQLFLSLVNGRLFLLIWVPTFNFNRQYRIGCLFP